MNASLRNFYRLLFGQKIESAQSVAPSSRKLRIESLEDRALLTAVALSTLDGSAAEGTDGNYGSWEISRSGSINTPCTVSFQLSSDSAVYGSDYTLYTSGGSSVYVYSNQGSVTIPSGSNSVTLQLHPVNDAERELSETVTLSLTTYSCGQESGSASGSGQVTIIDNDDWEVSVATSDAIAAESSYSSPNYGTYVFTRSNETDTTHSLNVRFQMTGTASSSEYSLYTASGSSVSVYSTYDSTTGTYIYTGSVDIPSGSDSVTVQLRPYNDAEKELTETAVLTLLPSYTEYGYGAYTVSETDDEASISIEDNDAWIVSVATSDATAAEAPYNSSNYGAYTITRSNETDTTHSLNVRFQMTGTASPYDYSLYTSTGSSISVYSTYDSSTGTYIYTGSVDIPSGSTTAIVELRPNNDAEREQTETATLTLLPSYSEYGYGAYAVDSNNSTASVSIEDNDDWTVSIVASDATSTEGLPLDYGVYTITRSGETDTTYSLNVVFRMTGTAEAFSDYSLYSASGSSISVYSNWDATLQTYVYTGSLTIPSGSLSTTVELRPSNDMLMEETESAVMTLTLINDGAQYGYGAYSVSGSASSATIQIEDNDHWIVSVAATDDTAAEGTPTNYGTYMITRSGETDYSSSLSVQFQMSGTATYSDYSLYTASGSSIYLYSTWDSTLQAYVYSGSVTIPANSNSVAVELRPYNDSYTESEAETAILTIKPSDYYYAVSSTNGSATVMIEDNDQWIVSVTATESTVHEGATNAYGEYKITRSNETDYSNSLDVQIQMSGVATANTDYWLYVPSTSSNVYLWPYQVNETYVYCGTVTIPANASSVTIQLHPYEDNCAETNDSAILTVRPSEYYVVSSTDGYASISIIDNDLWKINVEATDDTAKERLQGVEQDYGLFTFTREYSEENVIGDNSYAVTVYFDLIVIPDSFRFCAIPDEDFTLSVSPLNANDSTTYLQYLSNTGSTTTTNGFERYHYQGTIPAGHNSAAIRLQAIFDWLDEGNLFDFIGNPGEQPGEFTTLEITDVVWSNKGIWNAIGSDFSDEIEILDGAVCKLRTDSNNDGIINADDDLAKKVQGNAGRLFMVNSDNDNNNKNHLNEDLEDRLERPSDFNTPHNRTGGQSVTVANENDLAQTIAYAWIDSLTPVSGGAIEVDVYLIGPQEFVVWTAPTKGSRIHYGANSNNDNRMDYETTLTTLTASNRTYTNTFYVEANTLRPTNGSPSGDILLHADVVGVQKDGSDDVRFRPITVDCTDMAFNHDPGTNNDGAMNLRQDGSANTEIIAPEWSKSSDSTTGNDGNKNGKAVLYLPNQTVEVYARLTSTNIPAGTLVKVKANGKTADGTPLSIGDLDEQTFVVQSDGSLLPNVDQATLLTLIKSVNGIDNFVKFTTTGNTSSGVNYEIAKFQWEVTQIGGNATGSNRAPETDEIEIFTVLADLTSTSPIVSTLEAEHHSVTLTNTGGTITNNGNATTIIGGSSITSVTIRHASNVSILSSNNTTTVVTTYDIGFFTTIEIVGGTTIVSGDKTDIFGATSITVTSVENGSTTISSITVAGSTVTALNGSTETGNPWCTTNTASDDLRMPWVSALRFAIRNAGAKGTATSVLSQLTSFLHGQDNDDTTDVNEGHGLKYNTNNGSPSCTIFNRNNNILHFDPAKYINKTGVNYVNCYDQAAALVTFSRLLGIGVTYAYCRPFGFIHKTSLVGYDPSATITQPGSNTQINPTERYYTNDPFNLSSFEIDTSETYGYILKYDANNNLLVERSQFGNHAFAVYNGSVYDACAGPIKGVELLDYYSNTIDFVANQQWNQFHQLNGYLAESSNSMPQYNSFVVSIS